MRIVCEVCSRSDTGLPVHHIHEMAKSELQPAVRLPKPPRNPRKTYGRTPEGQVAKMSDSYRKSALDLLDRIRSQ